MQPRRNMYEIFPEVLDLNQGPSFNGLDTTGSDECRFAPTERCVLSNEIPGEKSYSSWDVGESSSRPCAQNHADTNNNDDSLDLSLEYTGRSIADVAAGSSGTSNARGAGGLFGNNQGQPSLIANSQEPTNQRSTNSSQRSTEEPSFNVYPFHLLYGASRTGISSSSGVNQDNSSVPTGRSNVNRINVRSSTRNGNIMLPNLNSTTNDQRMPNVMIPNLNATIDDEQVLNDSPPWDLFPDLLTESGERRGRRHIRHLPSDPSSSSGNQPRHHQPPLRLEIPDENALGADMDGRHRWLSEVRQILSVLRRGENVNAEDYMLIDPVINGVADLHDRHRDMRLDVDNMSYEELLALEERIGDVKTGLTEEVILSLLKQRKYFSFMGIVTQNSEPCCICQEEYNNGDDIGALDCGHEFHICCIKQWLTQKNLCPICKMPGLSK